ncbi:helix-turn-helix domain-containing protein [Burkholderia sp. Bmkn7]|uniref:helix-turn-helix domain-containing protein n=1 Tax=Burkholderia sp. Bmkn7 TaxID=3236841 RepID=UPI0034E5B75E
MAYKYLKNREDLFDVLAPTIDETVRYRTAMCLTELHGTAPKDLHKIVMDAAEHAVISVVLDFTKGNQALAAEYLGISRPTLRAKVRLNQ